MKDFAQLRLGLVDASRFSVETIQPLPM